MNQDHIFLDLAVTHPNVDIGQIIGLAAVRTDKRGRVLGQFSEKVALVEALAVSEEEHCPADYSADDWSREAAPFVEVVQHFRNTLLTPFDSHYVVVATHAETDKQFLAAAYKTHTLGVTGHLFKKRSWLDPLQIAWPMVYNDMMADRSFVSLCKHFGVTNSAPETATGDCAALVEVYWAMMSRYKGALIGEEVIREVGGNALATARRWLGV